MTTFTELVSRSASPAEIAAHLDGLSPTARVAECLALPGRLEPRLFDLVKGHAALTVEELVSPAESTVIYELKNNLPVFNISQKRFFRPRTGETVGYNHTTGLAATFAGPGYFFVQAGQGGEVIFDYTRLPSMRPEGWPEIRPNTGLIPGAVYGEMIDVVRRVSRDTVIGAAYRHDRPRNAWFLLTRAA
jgi:hypothetical protein